MVEDFQNKPHVKTMILSLKAGGTGLNLTKASNVIHYDLWWNPAVENQATDRAYRIGQQNNVMVYRMITEGTFEERINEMIRAKKELADLTVSTGENWIGDMSNQELKEVFALG
jgi:SNF2 family DNA or RNA helicase